MDAKNLEVLRQLKQAMAEPEKAKPKTPTNGFSEESLQLFKELAKAKFERQVMPNEAAPPNAQSACREKPSTTVKAQCRECKSVVAVEPCHATGHWLCHNCRQARKTRRREDAEAERAAQYLKAKGSKVEQVERELAAAKKQLSEHPDSNPAGLLIQIKQLEKRLEIERVHAISKYGKIRRYTVSGSYGSGRRTN